MSTFENINNINVVRFKRTIFWDIYIWSRKNKEKIIPRIIIFLNHLLMRIKQALCIPIYPCYEPFLAKKFAREAAKLYKKEHFDIVISEYHGYETLYAGYMLKKKYPEIKFIPIFWDSMSGGFPAKYLPLSYDRKQRLRHEERFCSIADKIIFMESSRAHHEKVSAGREYYNKVSYLDIPRFVRAPVLGKVDVQGFIKPECINIVYAGVLNRTDRSPEFILGLFERICAVKLNLIFLCIGEGIDIIKKRIGAYRHGLVVSGYVEQATLFEIYSQAGFLLNLGGSNPYMVPSKIFEYMSCGKPIISTYSIDDEASASYLKRYPLALLIDEREKDTDAQISRICNFIENTRGKTADFRELASTFYNNTPAAYAELIGNIL